MVIGLKQEEKIMVSLDHLTAEQRIFYSINGCFKYSRFCNDLNLSVLKKE